MRIIGSPNSSRAFGSPPASNIARRAGAQARRRMHRVGHCERVTLVVRVRAERKQSSNRLGQFRTLPRLHHCEVKQRRAVTSGRLQIGKRLCCRADCVLIVFYNGLRDSEQRRLIAKGWRGEPRHSQAHEKGYRSGQAAAQTVLRLGWRAQGFRGAHRPRRRKNIRSSLSPKSHGASAPKRFITIGRYGALTVDEARNRAKEILGAVATGEDAAADLALRRAASTFKEIADLSSGSMSDRSESCRRRRTMNCCLQPTRSPLWETARPRR